MSNRQKNLSSGPKTEEGKAVSAQNARKDSIFVKGYLPWEDKATKQKQFTEMVKQWRAEDPSRIALVRCVEQANLTIERLMHIERLKIEGAMQSVDVAQRFCRCAGISVLKADSLPHWFFVESGQSEKDYAMILAQIYDEAADLKTNFSDQLVARVKDEYPCLYDHVMADQRPNMSFLSVLGQRYKQSTVPMNLVALMNEITEKYPYHLIWTQAPERYQIIINAIRGEQMEAAIDFDKMQRHITAAQNRILKSFSGLAALDQHEQWISQIQQSIKVQALPLIESNGKDESGGDTKPIS